MGLPNLNIKEKMKWIPLVTKTSHRVSSQLGLLVPVYSELLHFSNWQGNPWYRFNKQNNNSASVSHVFANFYSPSPRYMENISTQTQIYFSLAIYSLMSVLPKNSFPQKNHLHLINLQSATNLLRHCTSIGWLRRTKESPPLPCPLHSKLGCLLFSIGS